MTRIDGGRRFAALACLAMAASLGASGCSGGSAHEVDPSRARDALVTALDAWKRGEDSKSIPAMTIQDLDWQRGAKLEGYEILGEGQSKGANLSVQVKLKIAAAPGKKAVEKPVYYLVGTSPSVTVFRDTLRR
ncbi:hypothetical protein [Aquisphaera giovannonii]|nr:hypothetical protein [Aquisphaera giovannonii]